MRKPLQVVFLLVLILLWLAGAWLIARVANG